MVYDYNDDGEVVIENFAIACDYCGKDLIEGSSAFYLEERKLGEVSITEATVKRTQVVCTPECLSDMAQAISEGR